MTHPWFVRRSDPLRKLAHWNRRAWQEIVTLKKRVDIIERALKMTNDENPNTIDGNPWEKEVVYDHRMTLIAFLAGLMIGASVVLTLCLAL